MIDFAELLDTGEQWELFARDFLSEIGFVVESTPDRGPDGGKDIIVIEDLTGKLNNYSFRWLVSCKHYAKSGKSVSEVDEPNILERLESFAADGFLGFYSTVPSSGFNTRLNQLRNTRKIKDFKIFDYKLIENYLIRLGYSKLLMRYFPESYKKVKPLHLIYNEYLPLKCKSCNKDLLESLNYEEYKGIIVYLEDISDLENDDVPTKYHIEDVYWVCKGKCDDKVEKSIRQVRKLTGRSLITGWEDISDLVIPAIYLKWLFATLNTLRVGDHMYSDSAFENLKYFISAMGQKVLREMTEQERDRIKELMQFGDLWL